MGTTIESDWENTRLLEELEAARAEIENVQLVSQLHYDANLSLRQQLAAEQAKNAGLRRAFIGLMQVVPRDVNCGNMHHKRKDQHEYDETCPVVSRYAEAIEQADKVLATPSDTSALEAIVKKAGEKMRENCITAAGPEDSYQDDWIRAKVDACDAIRALPAVTLEDLK